LRRRAGFLSCSGSFTASYQCVRETNGPGNFEIRGRCAQSRERRVASRQGALPASVLTFFHPDYTVGSGVSPDHAARSLVSTNHLACARGLYHRSGMAAAAATACGASPCPEGLQASTHRCGPAQNFTSIIVCWQKVVNIHF
jgi:hypothetical protein